jgi:hypothetical protein
MKAEDWIKVENKLPEAEDLCLVYDERQGVLIADYDGAWGFSNYEHGMLDYVTHWMPLVLPKSNKLWANI